MLQYQQSLFATSTNPKVISEAAKMNTDLAPSVPQPNQIMEQQSLRFNAALLIARFIPLLLLMTVSH